MNKLNKVFNRTKRPFVDNRDRFASPDSPTVGYKIRIMRDANLLTTSVFPRQINELNELLRSLKTATTREPSRQDVLRSQLYFLRPLSAARSASSYTPVLRERVNGSPTRIPKLSSISFCDNRDVISLQAKIEPLLLNMANHCTLVRSWMAYLCSRKDSHSELKTTLQADVLETITELETFCDKTNNLLSGYLSERDTLLDNCSTYPQVDDYKCALVDLDDGHYRKLHNVSFLLRDSYISFLNRLVKTFARIRKLETANTQAKFLRYL